MDVLQWVFTIVFLLFLLLIVSQLLMRPLKFFWRLLYNSLLGLVLLLMANWLGSFLGYSVPVNFLTIVIAGFLGVPGLIMLIILNLLMV